MKLYVGNLSFNTSESDLSNLFAQAGTVESCNILTDRDTGRSTPARSSSFTSDTGRCSAPSTARWPFRRTADPSPDFSPRRVKTWYALRSVRAVPAGRPTSCSAVWGRRIAKGALDYRGFACDRALNVSLADSQPLVRSRRSPFSNKDRQT